MKKLLAVGALTGLLLIGGTEAVIAKVKFPNPFHKHHKTKTAVTQDQAQAAALKKVSGTVSDSKTETVKGKQMYWFEIADSKGQKSQVWVDMLGKVKKVTKEKVTK